MNIENGIWIKSQFEGIDLKDERLNKRINIIASNMMKNPSASIPEQNNVWKDIKGAYRFFDSKQIDFNEIVRPHIDKTKKKIEEREIILAVQDTCYITYSHHLSVNGLSNIGGGRNSKNGKGIVLHNTLAIDPLKTHPEVIGILDQHIYNRNKSNDDEDWKETKLWQEASQRINDKNSNAHIVEVMDREGDVFDIMQNCLNFKHDYIIRSAYDRWLDYPSKIKLFDFIKKLKSTGVVKLDVRKKQGQVARKATLDISFSEIKICGPKNRKKEIIKCNVIYVIEKDPPKDQEPLEWILLTSIDIDSFEEACQVIKWYRHRWIIEEYHKCIKSGCKVEEKQLKEEFRIENFLGVANIIALRLLQLRDFARLSPKMSAKKVIEPLKVDILLKYNKIQKKEISIYEYYRLVASMGGFIGRKSDGEPGWQTLWKGETKLMLLVEGAKLVLSGGVIYG